MGRGRTRDARPLFEGRFCGIFAKRVSTELATFWAIFGLMSLIARREACQLRVSVQLASVALSY